MGLRTSLSFYTTTFYATLGLAACGGTVVSADHGDAGTGGATSVGGAAGNGGIPKYTGGASGHAESGGAGAGGFVGGAGGAGASAGHGGAGGVIGQPTFLPCASPKDVLDPSGKETGYVQCAGGSLHRTASVACATTLPRAEKCTPTYDAGIRSACTHDSDCTDQPNGYCATGGQIPNCYCDYGCTRDADCEAGNICLCGEPVGRCVPATCTTDSDCGGGLCLSYEASGCDFPSFACQNPNDSCASDSDCTAGSCWADATGVRACEGVRCTAGRPFLVGQEARVASATGSVVTVLFEGGRAPLELPAGRVQGFVWKELQQGSTARRWKLPWGEMAKGFLPYDIDQRLLLPPDLRAWLRTASKHKAMSYERMPEAEKKLEDEIQRLLTQAERVDGRGGLGTRQRAPRRRAAEELMRREDRVRKIREVKAALEQEAREKAAAKAVEAYQISVTLSASGPVSILPSWGARGECNSPRTRPSRRSSVGLCPTDS